jgi:hypothetical protein
MGSIGEVGERLSFIVHKSSVEPLPAKIGMVFSG